MCFGDKKVVQKNIFRIAAMNLEYRTKVMTSQKTFLHFAFQHFQYHISVEEDEKPPQPQNWLHDSAYIQLTSKLQANITYIVKIMMMSHFGTLPQINQC